MAVYRQIQVSFWQDGFILDLTPEEKYFYIYLMTNSKTSQCGIYELPKKIIETETGFNRDTVNKLLDRFIQFKKILYCEATKEIMILNWVKYNFINSKNTISCINNELREIKNSEFLKIFYKLCQEYGYPVDDIFKGLVRGYKGACNDLGEEKEKEEEKEEEEKKEKEKEDAMAMNENLIQDNKELSLSLDSQSIELCKYFETLRPGQSISKYVVAMKILIERYGFEWVKEALQITVKNKHKFIQSYMEAILQNWEKEKRGNNDGSYRSSDKQDNENDKVEWDFSNIGGTG